MNSRNESKLNPHLSQASVWAFSLGTSIGWGSLVVTANSYLAQAGPVGSLLGILAGTVMMLLIARSYSYLMSCYPEAGGAYTFCREAFGYDHGFLVAWFLCLTYLAILWANLTSLPLFARYFLGEVFEFGRMYSLFGYEVYFGEALLSIAFLLLAALLCARFRDAASALMTGLVVLFSVGITVCFAAALLGGDPTYTPAFIPESGRFNQVFKIAMMSPWAFIGFESISHATEEFRFTHKRIHRVLVLAVLSTGLLYAFVTLLSVTAYPARYPNWLAYIRDLGNLDGIEALPAFYAAQAWLGKAGTGVLMASLLALILTSLIGNISALSRLFYALGRDQILPASFGQLSSRGTPSRGVLLVAGVSLLVPFLGRTAIGWIVDVTTLGATLIYGLVSAAAYREARFRNDRAETAAGLAGLILMVGFGLYLLLPNLLTTGSMEPESYFLFVVWAVLGFFVFRWVLKHDRKSRFGRSIIVWIALLSLILFVSLVWMNQSIMNVTNRAMHTVESLYTQAGLSEAQADLITRQMAEIRTVSARSILVVLFVFALSLGVLVQNYRLMSRMAADSQQELKAIRDVAGRDTLTGVKSKLAYSEAERDYAERMAAGQQDHMALAVLDVNGLKYVNDTLGHQAGDELIQKASRMICMYFAHSPVYRTGGDEFVVLMQGEDFENREAILNLFRKESEAHIASGDVVVSLGTSDYRPGEDASLQDLFRRADERMYEDKKRLKSLGAATRL